MRTILVTGGAGFIGSNFVHLAMRERDDRVVVVDKLTYAGRRENLAQWEDDARFRFVVADIADGEAVSELFASEDPQWVINFAAESHVDRSIDGPRPFFESNVGGTFELLEAARRTWGAGAIDRRLLHVSTDEVFGSLGADGAFSETTPYAPSSPYSATKAAADHLVRAYHRTYDLPAIVTNCSNNFGPYQFPEKLIPVMLLKALRGEALPIYGDGSNVRDWLFVEDHCRGLVEVLERGVPGESYNLGGGCEKSNLEVVDAICSLLEEERPAAENPALAERGVTAYGELLSFVADRPGHDHRYAIDASKIVRELGWRPQHDFLSALGETVRWYLDHLDWCREVSLERQGLAAEPAAEIVS